MISLEEYFSLKNKLIELGYNEEIESIKWILSRKKFTKDSFLKEYIWVVVNSGMKNQVAEIIFHKIIYAINNDINILNFFKNKSKVDAINFVKNNLNAIYREFKTTEDKISYLESLPQIGPITKYHLARNLGIDIFKPDRHLVRIANERSISVEELCGTISNQSGDKIGIVDLVLWRCGNLGLL